MKTKIVEATNEHFNWGKFLVGVPDTEWERKVEVDGDPGRGHDRLLARCGWSDRHIWVLDLQTGEGAYFLPTGMASADIQKHAIWVCPLFEPFLEWLIHVYGLHAKPRTLFGRRLDPLYARRHRMHHRDPRNIPLVFVPLPVLAGFLIVLGAIAFFAFPPLTLKLTAYATMTTFLFGYEWSHFLIHSSYVPRTWVFRAVWRNHILHHYKNEKYWFGVTNPIADYALRTHPAKEAVASSPTARTLGVDDEFTLIREDSAA